MQARRSQASCPSCLLVYSAIHVLVCCVFHIIIPLSTVQEWCTKWEIHVPLGDIKGEESLLDDLHNLCDNTKMVAIAAVAHLARLSATIKSKASKSSLQLSLSQSQSNATVTCPPLEVTEDMVCAVRRLLEDSTEHVRVPSAVLLYCLDRECEKVRDCCTYRCM